MPTIDTKLGILYLAISIVKLIVVELKLLPIQAHDCPSKMNGHLPYIDGE